MNWEECINRNLMEKRTPDKELAKSLLNIAVDRFNFFLSKDISVFTLEGVYESIMELGHAFLALEGLKTISHECVIEFLKREHIDDYEAEFLHKLRRKRHGIKYYGKMLNRETIEKNVREGKNLFLKLKSIAEKKLVK